MVYDLINTINCPDFILDVRSYGCPEGSPSTRALRRQLEEWVGLLDVETVSDDCLRSGIDACPRFEWRCEGWDLELVAIPKRPSARGNKSRPIGITGDGPRGVDPGGPVVRSLEDKSQHYGPVDLPLVVAVDALDRYARFDSVVEALVGPIATLRDEADEVRFCEAPDGVWHRDGVPRNTNISAVMIGVKVGPWCLGSRLDLFHNPWADLNVDSVYWAGNQWRKSDDAPVFRRDGGSDTRELLRL